MVSPSPCAKRTIGFSGKGLLVFDRYNAIFSLGFFSDGILISCNCEISQLRLASFGY